MIHLFNSIYLKQKLGSEAMEEPTVYTIGHSTHQIDYFLELLREYKINCVVDIRSVPASAYNPQYNKEPFKAVLKRNDITYLSFAEEFGARQTDPELLDENGQLDFVRVRKSWFFKQGLERIWQGIHKNFVIAIMCSEAEPLDCHRFSMVSVGLESDGINVRHILKDRTSKSHTELEKELLKKYDNKIPQNDLFNQNVTIDEQLTAAYRLKNREIGYLPNSIEQKEGGYD